MESKKSLQIYAQVPKNSRKQKIKEIQNGNTNQVKNVGKIRL